MKKQSRKATLLLSLACSVCMAMSLLASAWVVTDVTAVSTLAKESDNTEEIELSVGIMEALSMGVTVQEDADGDGIADSLQEDADEADLEVTEDGDIEDTVTIAEANDVDFVMSNVSDKVNVREEPSTEASVVGKLYENCYGVILDSVEGWTQIESGELVGWVSNDYLLFGEEAAASLEENGTLKATVLTDSLRVRKEASTDAGVYKLVKTGTVLEAVEELGDWVSIQVDEDTIGYVSAEYVSVEFAADTGKTNTQIKEEENAAAMAKLTANQGAVPTSVSDVELLAALIQAEAGTQSYEGQLAVGAVVMNRVRSSGYPNTILAVITASGQFPPATNGTVSSILAKGVKASCLQAAQAAVNGETNVGSATHFGKVGKADGIVIGSHVFY